MSNAEVEAQEYDTIDEILVPEAAEETLAAAAQEVAPEFGGPEDDDVGGGLPDAFPQEQEQQTAQQETEAAADEDPAEVDDATVEGDEDGQEAQDSVEFDSALLQASGLEESEARAQFGTPEALENALRLADIQAVKWAQQQSLVNRGQAQQQPVQQHPAQQQPKPVEQSGEAEEELELPELPDGEEWDDDVVAVAQTLVNHFNQKLQAANQRFEEQLGQATQITQTLIEDRAQATLNEYVEEFDGFVNGLGDEWSDILGKGSGPELIRQDPKSQAIENRIHLDTVSKQLSLGRQQQGLLPLPRALLLERALRVAFPQNQEHTVRKQVESEVAKRGRLQTSRPGNTSRRQLTPEQKAVQRAEQWYAKQGMASDAMDNLEYDEI